MSAKVAQREDDQARVIPVGETVEGDPYALPVEDLLTGRGAVLGKSGSGKSNTGSVIAEELLERGHPLLAIDIDGEYWGLKEEYEILHVGATDECDLQVGPEHAEKLAELALGQRVPIILDVSGYIDTDVADDIVRDTARELFAREQQAMQPFLMLVEEIHEYIPQQGALDETGEMLIRIAKRGRKRGLGIIGISQRPANVKKDFITQADLLVWHRLTWDNDTRVVDHVVGEEYGDRVPNLCDGEAFVQTDWLESEVEEVQFWRKQTFDAGAAPSLDDIDRPELKSISEDLINEVGEVSKEEKEEEEKKEEGRQQDRIAELEARLENKRTRIAELEEEVDDTPEIEEFGEAFIDAVKSHSAGKHLHRELLERKEERIRALESALETVRAERDVLREDGGIEQKMATRRIIDRSELRQRLEEWDASTPHI